MFGRWNLVCGGLLAFPISRNFFDLEFRLESIYLGWMLFPRWIIPYPLPWYTAARQLLKLISRERRNIRVCHFHTGFRSPRSFDTRHFQIDSKNLNKPQWGLFDNLFILVVSMGCIQFFQIRSNDISIERAHQADPHSKMADLHVVPLRRYRFLEFKTSQT